MPRLIWTPRALADVARLHRFLALENADAARRAVGTIRNGVDILARHPHVGRPIDDMVVEFREWLIGFGDSGYVVLYRFDGDDVVLLAVRHQREAGYR